LPGNTTQFLNLSELVAWRFRNGYSNPIPERE